MDCSFARLQVSRIEALLRARCRHARSVHKWGLIRMLSSGGLRLSRAPSEVGTERNDPRRVQGLDRIIAALDVVRARVTNARMSAKSRMEMAPQLLKSK